MGVGNEVFADWNNATLEEKQTWVYEVYEA